MVQWKKSSSFGKPVFVIAICAMTLGLGPTTEPSRPMQSADRPPSLERTMKQMNGLFKTIDTQLDDAGKDASTLTLINTLEATTVAAKGINPDEVGELVGNAKTRAIADYRVRVIALLKSEFTTEEALLRNDHPAARKAFAAIVQERKDGHEAYGVDDDHHK